MPKLTKTQQDAIDTLRARLDVQHPGFRASDEIRTAFGAEHAGLYLRTWVLPLLDVIERGAAASPAGSWNLKRDAAAARIALRDAKDAKLLAEGKISRSEPENSIESPEGGLLSNLRTDEPDDRIAGDEECA